MFLRKIRKAKWYKHGDVHWLPAGELQADALGDLSTKNNELSVWHVNDDRSNLEQVVTALATAGEFVSNVDYALFDYELVQKLHIEVSQGGGSTPDESANNAWHRNLVELSANKLSALAIAIEVRAEKARIGEMKILSLIKQAVLSGRIQRSNLNTSVQVKID